MTAVNISLAHLHLAWPALWPMLEAAVKRSPDKPDVLADLLAERAQLWAILENGRPIAAVATMIKEIDGERRCLLWLVGACPEASRRGSRVKEWAAAFLAVVEPWARAQGCSALYGGGRPGWARIVERFGGLSIDPIDGKPAWRLAL